MEPVKKEYPYRSKEYSCRRCFWKGIGKDSRLKETGDNRIEIQCPNCWYVLEKEENTPQPFCEKCNTVLGNKKHIVWGLPPKGYKYPDDTIKGGCCVIRGVHDGYKCEQCENIYYEPPVLENDFFIWDDEPV